ncbi:hypothetical protein ACOXXX_00190 [Thalassococcus sp. BH17M4-6]|uniref:hypothetical protein n=1 Tax=Thalassococcus sp. BH17M4-6 TaxID=3413148 RepID=UPI003BEC7E51
MSGPLHQRLLAAHASGDGRALVGLYAEAAAIANSKDAACFFLTHAYVHALEAGDARAAALHAALKSEGREA